MSEVSHAWIIKCHQKSEMIYDECKHLNPLLCTYRKSSKFYHYCRKKIIFQSFVSLLGAGSRLEEVYMSPEYPFDIFVCVAMLTECRDMIMKDSDINSVYQILSQ